MNGYLRAFSLVAHYRGRSTRGQVASYYGVYLALALVTCVMGLLIGLLMRDEFVPGRFLLAVIIIHAPVSYALNVRRLHDAGCSGWWVMAIFAIDLVDLGQVIIKGFDVDAAFSRYDLLSLAMQFAFIVFLLLKPTASPDWQSHSPMEHPEPRAAAISELERLTTLRERGSLTAAEFDTLKAGTLSGAEQARLP